MIDQEALGHRKSWKLERKENGGAREGSTVRIKNEMKEVRGGVGGKSHLLMCYRYQVHFSSEVNYGATRWIRDR